MLFKRQLTIWMFLLMPFLVLAQGDKIPLNPKIKSGQLPNGLKYFIIQNKKPEKKIELRLAVNAGSILEDNDQLGLAHLMEHMNFNGLKNFPKNEVVHYLQSIGVDFGADLNAYTGFDETVYILPIPSDDKSKIDKGFQIIADWSGAALLENEEIDAERKVVLEESRLGKGADDRMMKIWFPEYLNGSKYAQRLPIGDDELLKTFKHDVIKRFHADWYRPDLEAVLVVGDIDPAEAERLIKEKFSGFKNPAKERERPAVFPMQDRTVSKAMICSDKETPYTILRIIGNAKPHKTSSTLKEYMHDVEQLLFNSMLGNRLDELRSSANPPFIFAGAGVENSEVRGYDNFQTVAVCGNDKIAQATEAIIGEVLKVKKYGFTSQEFERAKAELLSNYEKSFNEKDKTESRRLVDELVRHFLTGECAPGIEWEYNTVKNNLSKLSLDEVNSLKQRIDLDQTYFALVTTKEGSTTMKDAELKQIVDAALKKDVAAYTEKALPTTLLVKQPTPGKVTATEQNAKAGTTTYTLSNGAKVTYKKTDFKNDEIIFSAYRHGGSSTYEGKDYQSADFSNNVVDEMGYGLFSANDLAKFLKGKNVNVNTVVDLNSDMISGNSSVKDFETAMQLLYLKCTEPRVDREAFASFKNRQMQMFNQMKSDPGSAYNDSLNRFLYKNHPRSKDIPDQADFDQIDLPHAISFYNMRFKSANGMNFFFVGSIPEENFKSMIEKYIGGLGQAAVVAKSRDLNMDPIEGNNSFTFNMGKEPKSMVTEMMYFYTPYSREDELRLNLLGEVINNRITDIIREKMSAIYGGGVGLRLSKFPKEKFTMQSFLPCGPENAEKVKNAFWDICKEVQKPGNITADEMTKAVETMAQKMKVAVKTNNFWISSLQKFNQLGLPYEDLLKVEEAYRKINAQQLSEVAKKYFNSKNVLHALMMPES